MKLKTNMGDFIRNFRPRVGDPMIYRKIPNISPVLIEVRKHVLGALYSAGLIFRGRLIVGGHFVLVSEYQDLEIHCYISLL